MSTSPASVRDKTIVLPAVCVCFLLSGFAALLYQTAWMRQLSTVFGTSDLAVATVLAAYMAGLALGAALASKFIHRIRRPVLAYAVLEAAIAISALAVPFLLQVAGLGYGALFGGQSAPPDAAGSGQSLFYLVVTFIVLLIPTACMGATLPMLTRYAVRSDRQVGPRVGLLYAINTVGAIAGTLTAAFLLLPMLGLMGTIIAGAIVNLIVFGVAALLAQGLIPSNDTHPSPVASASIRERSQGWILPTMLVAGVTTFSYEVLWTRLLSHILGGSLVAFATMLASFLAGIAIGSGVASRLAKSREYARMAFFVSQLGLAASSLTVYLFLDKFIPEVAGLAGNVMRTVVLLLPGTLFIGATYPLAVRILSRDEQDAASASARVYAWNTVGAIAGALLAGFYLIPLLGYEGVIKILLAVNLSLALVATLTRPGPRLALAGMSAALLMLVALGFKPQAPEGLLRVSPLNDDRNGRIRFYDVGRSATILLLERDGNFYLRANGLPEATVKRKGAPPSMHSQRLLGALPVIARPDSETMLIVGLGGGVVAEGIPSSVQDIDIVELEPKVIEANRAISNERSNDPLMDPRVNIVVNDARNALRLTNKQYDIIVSQPSHPWTAGASHLYTHEYMQLVRSRLSTSGVFLQWIDAQFVSEALLRSFAATLADVFPQVRAYQFQPNVLLLLASDQPIEPEKALIMRGEPLKSHRQDFLSAGIASVNDLVASLAWDDAGIRRLAAGSPVITDNDNRMAMFSSRAFEARGFAYGDLKKLLREYGPLYDPKTDFHKELGGVVSYQYLGDRLARLQAPELMQALAQALQSQGRIDQYLMLAKAHRADGDTHRSDRLLIDYLRRHPSNAEACYLLFAERRHAIVEAEAPQAIRQYRQCLQPDAYAVLEAWDASVRGDYQLARDRDDVLASARHENPWYLKAAQLRAGWRINAMIGGQPNAHGKEAAAILDDVISVYQDIDLLQMRMTVASLTGNNEAVVETAQQMLLMIANDVASHSQLESASLLEARSLAQRIRLIRDHASAVRNKQGVLKYRLDALDQRIDALLLKLRSSHSRV